MSLKKIESKFQTIERSKNYSKKFAIIEDLYCIIHKNVLMMKDAKSIDSRELVGITKSLETLMKTEYVLDSEVSLINSNVAPSFDFD